MASAASELMVYYSPIPGLILIKDIVSPLEETELLKEIDSAPWSTALSRRTQHYGFEYSYSGSSVLTPAPPFLKKIASLSDRLEKFECDDIPSFSFKQAIVNEYLPGQGISPHIDNTALFGETIISVSLGSDIVMDFSLKIASLFPSLPLAGDVFLPRRSALVIHYVARNNYTHSIAKRKTDSSAVSIPWWGMEIVPRRFSRERRVSVTFREVK